MNAQLKNAPGLMGPPDDPPSVFDDLDVARDVLVDAGYPDYIACVLADVASRGWAEAAWMEALRDVKRHVQPIFEEA